MGLIDNIFAYTPQGMIANALGKAIGPLALDATDQAANIEAIYDYFGRTTPANEKSTKIKDDFMKWYAALSWYQKNIDTNIAAQAFNMRNDFMRADATADEIAKVNDYLKGTPARDVVTGNATPVTSTGDYVVQKPPLIPTSYKIVAVATASGVAALVLLKKLHLL